MTKIDSMLFAEQAYLPGGWRRDVLLRWNAAGALVDVSADAAAPAGVARANGPLLPGMPNLHSHAFQRAMAGLTEYRANPSDTFWSWRDLMYRFALKITPDALAAVARWLYVEMLKSGYTSVCEFHYVHHAPDGALCAARGAGGARGRRGAGRGHRHHDAAGRVSVQRLRRARAARRPASFHQYARRAARAGRRVARRVARAWRAALRHRAALAARGVGKRAASARWRDAGRCAGAHPYRRADRGSRRLHARVRRAAGAVAPRALRRERALVPRARDASRRRRDAGARTQRRDRGPVPDDRGESRRRHFSGGRLSRGGRRDRHRFGQPRERRLARRVAALRIRAAARAARAQRACRRGADARGGPAVRGVARGRRARPGVPSARSRRADAPTGSCSIPRIRRSPSTAATRGCRARCSPSTATRRCSTCTSAASGW